jgi:hypothetical protein
LLTSRTPRSPSPSTSSRWAPPPSLFRPYDLDPTGDNRSLTESVRIDLGHAIPFKSNSARSGSGRNGTNQWGCAACRSLDSPDSIFVLNYQIDA